ncbi:MAG: lipid A biosynthesis acyltransferase [Cellvibrio sp.]
MKKRKPHHLPPSFSWQFLLPQFWPTWLALGIGKIVAQLPFDWVIGTGRVLGGLFYRYAPKRVAIARANIQTCFPTLEPTTQEALIKESVINCGIGMAETLLALFGRRSHFLQRVSIEGIEHLTARKQGVLLVGCHMTTLEMAGRLLATAQTFDILYRRDPNPLLAWALVSARAKFNGESILSVETRRLVKHLQQGRIVWYAPDQDYGIKHSLFAPFFNEPAATVPGTAHFARLGRAKVIFFAHHRDEKNHYHIKLTPAKPDFPSGDDLADATYVNQMFESMIEVTPEQYLWVHRRFKTRPPSAEPIYPIRQKRRKG